MLENILLFPCARAVVRPKIIPEFKETISGDSMPDLPDKVKVKMEIM
jgi:hypothetical protein